MCERDMLNFTLISSKELSIKKIPTKNFRFVLSCLIFGWLFEEGYIESYLQNTKNDNYNLPN